MTKRTGPPSRNKRSAMIADQLTLLQLTSIQFKPKKFGANDVDIKIECCGVCGSDVHSITGGWGEVPLPICVGHEVIGKAVKVGDKVTSCKVGDRVGVGAQIWSCMKCKQCKSDNENYCPHMVGMYHYQWIRLYLPLGNADRYSQTPTVRHTRRAKTQKRQYPKVAMPRTSAHTSTSPFQSQTRSRPSKPRL